MAVALVAAPVLVARQRLGRVAGGRLPPQPGAGRRRGRRRRRRRRRRCCWSFAAARRRSRSRRSPSCRCGCRSRSAGETANLLVPLYLVIAAGVIASMRCGRRTERRVPTTGETRGPAPALAARGDRRPLRDPGVATRSTSRTRSRTSASSWSRSRSSSCLLVEVEWTRQLLRRALIAVGAVAVGCALIGIYQYFVRDLFLNPELVRRERAPRLLPGQLDLLRPEHLRPLPGAGADGVRRLHRLGRRADATSGRRGGRSPSGWWRSRSATRSPASPPCSPGSGSSPAALELARASPVRRARRSSALVALVIAGGTPTSDIEDVRSIDSGHADLTRAA